MLSSSLVRSLCLLFCSFGAVCVFLLMIVSFSVPSSEGVSVLRWRLFFAELLLFATGTLLVFGAGRRLLQPIVELKGSVDAFVVRKAEKKHGMQRRIEGPDVAGRRVLVVEDVSTTGSSPLAAVEALRDAGAEVVGVALIVDRGAGPVIREAGLACRAAYGLADLGLG